MPSILLQENRLIPRPPVEQPTAQLVEARSVRLQPGVDVRVGESEAIVCAWCGVLRVLLQYFDFGLRAGAADGEGDRVQGPVLTELAGDGWWSAGSLGCGGWRWDGYGKLVVLG